MRWFGDTTRTRAGRAALPTTHRGPGGRRDGGSRRRGRRRTRRAPSRIVGPLVAVGAGREEMHAGERQPRVPVDLASPRVVPAERRMAPHAVPAELPSVRILVAGHAVAADYEPSALLGVTGGAAHGAVLSGEGEPGTRMVETGFSRHRPHGRPSMGRVARTAFEAFGDRGAVRPRRGGGARRGRRLGPRPGRTLLSARDRRRHQESKPNATAAPRGGRVRMKSARTWEEGGYETAGFEPPSIGGVRTKTGRTPFRGPSNPSPIRTSDRSRRGV